MNPRILHTEPFQLRLPQAHPMFGENEERYSTFVAEVRWGLLGVEAEFALFEVTRDPGELQSGGFWGAVDGPGWWSALGLVFVPGPELGAQTLRLFYLPNTHLERPQERIIDLDLSGIAGQDDGEALQQLLTYSGFRSEEGSLQEA